MEEDIRGRREDETDSGQYWNLTLGRRDGGNQDPNPYNRDLYPQAIGPGVRYLCGGQDTDDVLRLKASTFDACHT